MKDITIPANLILDDVEYRVLCDLFSCGTEEELATKLGPYVSAAAREYVDMFTGSGPITTATDVRERRLVSIIQHGLRELPDAALIGRLFKLPLTSASALIRTVSAKHDVKVTPAVNATLLAIVKTAKQDSGDKNYYMVVRDSGLVRILNTKLADAPDGQGSVNPVRETANRYWMKAGARTYLLKILTPPTEAGDAT